MGLKPNFNPLVKELAAYDAAREKLINQGRVVLRMSKQLIYSLHRDDIPTSKKLSQTVRKERTKLDNLASHTTRMTFEGSYSDALQEYVEASCLFEYITNKKIPTKSSLKVSTTDYLLGMCDFTGELARRAVLQATKQNFQEVIRIRELVNNIHGEFLKFNLRNSQLRKKYDQIKWNLNKIEDVMYDISKREV